MIKVANRVADSPDHYWLGATLQADQRWVVTAAGFYINRIARCAFLIKEPL